jgi:hypothetical protein
LQRNHILGSTTTDQMMGVDPLEKEWEDLKSTSRDKEYIKRIKEVFPSV